MDLRVAALNRGPSHAFYQNESGDFYISYISDGTAVFQPFEDFKVQSANLTYEGFQFEGEIDYALFSGVNSTERFLAYESGSSIVLNSGASEIASFSGQNPILVIFLNKSGAEDSLRLFYTHDEELRYREQFDYFSIPYIAETGGRFDNSQYLAILGETFEDFRASLLYKKDGRFFEAYSSQDINYVKDYCREFVDFETGSVFPFNLGNGLFDCYFEAATSYQYDFSSYATGLVEPYEKLKFDSIFSTSIEEGFSEVCVDFDDRATGDFQSRIIFTGYSSSMGTIFENYLEVINV